MKEEILQTVKHYAASKGKSTAWVYGLIKNNKIKFKEIDGVKFIVI